MLEDSKRTTAMMKEKRLSNYNESKTLEGEELQDSLDFELLSEYFLLIGYGLECILKGCLLTKWPKLVNNDGKLDKMVTNHNLRQLFADNKIKLSPLEQQITEIITWYVKWRKYPVPKDLNQIPWLKEPGSFELDIPGSPLHERILQKTVNGLFQRGYDLLDKTASSQNNQG